MSKEFELLIHSINDFSNRDESTKSQSIEEFKKTFEKILELEDEILIEVFEQLTLILSQMQNSTNFKDKIAFIKFLSLYINFIHKVQEKLNTSSKMFAEEKEQYLDKGKYISFCENYLLVEIENFDSAISIESSKCISVFFAYEIFNPEDKAKIRELLIKRLIEVIPEIKEKSKILEIKEIQNVSAQFERSTAKFIEALFISILPLIIQEGNEDKVDIMKKVLDCSLLLDEDYILNKAFVITNLYFIQNLIEKLPSKENLIFELTSGYILNCLESLYTEVRFISTKITDKLVTQYKANEELFKKIIPRICFNRLYPAHSLSQSSLALWKKAVGTEGKKILGTHTKDALEFYFSQIASKNFEIREASCKGIQEIYSKVVEGNEDASIQADEIAKMAIENLKNTCQDTHFSVREYSFFAIIKVTLYLIQIMEYLDKRQKLPEYQTSIIEIGKYNFGETQSEVRKACSHLLATLYTRNKVEEEEFQKEISGIIERFREQIGGNHNEIILHNESTIGGHRHFSSTFCAILDYIKEKISLKCQVKEIEGFWNLFFEAFYIGKFEKSKNFQNYIWILLSEIVSEYGKTHVKTIFDSLLLNLCELYHIETDLSLKNTMKEFGRKLANIMGPQITKGRIEGIENGKFNEISVEILGI